MSLRKFEDFLKSGIVKKQTPNKERSNALINESEDKYKFLKTAIKNIPK